MADFLTAVSTRKVKPEPIQEIQSLSIKDAVTIDSAESALAALKNQPDSNTLSSILKFLSGPKISLLTPEPVYASIAHQLVSDTLPNYWKVLEQRPSWAPDANVLPSILRNPTGIGHLITRLRSLITGSRQGNTSELITDVLGVLERVFDKNTSYLIWKDIQTFAKNDVQKKLMWKEYLVQVGSGRIISVAAEAEDMLKGKVSDREASWISDGNRFADFLARNVVNMLQQGGEDAEFLTAVVELCSKVLGLGYTDRMVSLILRTIVEEDQIELFPRMVSQLKGFEQRKYINATMAFVATQYFQSHIIDKEDAPIRPSPTISGVACLLQSIVKDSELLKDHIVSSLTRPSTPTLDDSLAVRRSVLAVLSQDEDKLHTLLENCIKLFGDSVYIKHTPIMQQEALAQTLALCCGYVQRSQPMYLTMMAKSSYHVNGMSNRIGATSPRARFLGIAVGTAISRMVDKPELQLKIELEGAEADESQWYQRLTELDDKIGRIEDLRSQQSNLLKESQPPKPKIALKTPRISAVTEIKGPRVIEVLTDSEDEDADLTVYEKPDSDPEDDTDDPTAINRNKPTAPVYIRDLLAGLRDQTDFDRHELALATAASLIRRKASFGTEVIDHLEDLATVLTGLQDGLELASFSQQRQQALIAVLLAQPARMGQWFARSFFTGDYSLAQRTAILTTLGLGARELAGIKDAATEDQLPPSPSFPSAQLPPALHALYTNETTSPVAKLSSSMARAMLSPLAASAADELSGPTALKVRTFSTRMAVEAARTKPAPNALAQIVADNIFFPLTGRWWLQTRSSGDSIFASPQLLPSFLQTLALLLNAAGRGAVALPQMTRELWDVLLGARARAGDKNVLSAVLFGLLMVLETNDAERVATEHGREVMETLAWARDVFGGLSGGGEDERVRALAAGVVVRCQEVVDKYQRRMVGALMDY